MKSVSRIGDVVVTGSSGFMGSRLCRELSHQLGHVAETRAVDVLDKQGLKNVAGQWRGKTVIHLAASGAVVSPIASAPAMFASAMHGTHNVLEVLRPKVLIVSSSCAAYGNTPVAVKAKAGETDPKPVGLYGLSKQAIELLTAGWTEETGHPSVIFRIGNVIGPGCGGLIPYLVRHGIQYPDASEPARLRGGGRITRDYVPVGHVCRVLAVAAGADWSGIQYLNLGSGRGLSNGQVAELVSKQLAESGIRVRIEWRDSPASGEAWHVLLDVNETTNRLRIPPPDERTVSAGISDAVRFHLQKHKLTAAQDTAAS